MNEETIPVFCDNCGYLKSVCECSENRIEDLQREITDLKSELARKKYSLTVACNRVEELEKKLEKAKVRESLAGYKKE